MRYDTPVYFQLYPKPEYDYSSGDYADIKPVETMVRASVVDTSIDTMHLVYGGIRQGSKTIHLQNRYRGMFDSIRIGNMRYAVDMRRPLGLKEVFILSEVQ